MDNEVRIPDAEIIVGASGNDIAVVCFYGRDDIHAGYDVVCAIGSTSEVKAVVTLLQDAITSLNNSSWFSVDELDAFEGKKTEDVDTSVDATSSSETGGSQDDIPF